MYLDSEGHVSLGSFPGEAGAFGDYQQSLLDTLLTLDGFGVVSPVFFPLDGDINADSLPEDAAASVGEDATAFIVDADPGSATAFARIPAQVQWLPERQMIALRPSDGHPLSPGGRYAAVLTRGVRSPDGRGLGPAPAFAEIRDARDAPNDPLQREIFDRYDSVLLSLEGDGIPRQSVAALAVFHVQTVGDDLVKAREQVWEAEVPPIVFDEIIKEDRIDARLGMPQEEIRGLDVEGGVAHAHIAFMIHGRYDAPNYLNARPKVHGVFERDEAGALRVKHIDEVHFTLFLPSTLENLRVVIFQHGLSVDRTQALPIADALCAAGYAVLAIDAPYHGMRATATPVDSRNNFTGAEMSDSFGDAHGAGIVIDYAGVTDVLGPLVGFHPFYMRDALRQSAADLGVGVRVIRDGDFAPLGSRDDRLQALSFSEEPLGFIGYSLGGIIGTAFLATEPEVGAAVLPVTGGSLAHLVPSSPWLSEAYFGQLFPLLGLRFNDVDYDALHPSFFPEIAVWQTLFDRGDSMSYAGALRRSNIHVLMQMAREDETLPNIATESLARAIELPIAGATPSYVELATDMLPLRNNIESDEGMLTRGLVVYEEADHSLGYLRTAVQTVERPVKPPFSQLEMPRSFANPIDESLSQVVHFFETWRSGTAEINHSGDRLK